MNIWNKMKVKNGMFVGKFIIWWWKVVRIVYMYLDVMVFINKVNIIFWLLNVYYLKNK